MYKGDHINKIKTGTVVTSPRKNPHLYTFTYMHIAHNCRE